MKKVTLLIALLFILSACQSRPPAPVDILPTPSRTPSPTGTPTPNATERYQGTLQANQTANAGYALTQLSRQTEIVQTQMVQVLTPSITPTITITPTPTVFFSPTPNPVTGLIVTLGEEIDGPWHRGDLAFSLDGMLIAMTGEKIRIWNVYTHQLIYILNEPHLKCQQGNISFSPDGKLLAISKYFCWGEDDNGYLRVWDLSQQSVIHESTLDVAKMYEPNHSDYFIPVGEFVFLPDSKQIAIATGNTIEIRDISESKEPIILDLGEKMYANEISISEDGRFLIALMEWNKWNTFPAFYKDEFGLQIWTLQTYSLNKEIDYPEIETVTESMQLYGEWLSHIIFVDAIFEMTNLVTEEVRAFPYRLGRRYLSADRNFILFVRLNGLELGDDDQIELWDTDTWRNLYTFLPDFAPDWQFSQLDFKFSPDNKILAISHQEQLSLWNIEPVISP